LIGYYFKSCTIIPQTSSIGDKSGEDGGHLAGNNYTSSSLKKALVLLAT